MGELAAQWVNPDGLKSNGETLEFVRVVSAVAGAMTGDGSAQSVNTAVMTGVNAAQNNYLAHAEAQRLAELKQKQLLGQCDTSCQKQIDWLNAVDAARNQKLNSCANSNSADCSSARSELRTAAAEYIRLNAVVPSVSTVYQNERNETLTLARQTMQDYTIWNVTKGVGGSVLDGAKALGGAAYTGFKALLGNEQAQQDVKAGLGATWDFVKEPGNWPELMGAMSPVQREQLAQAYERGDGKTVASMLGEQLTNLPGAGGAGTIKTVVKTVDKAQDVTKLAVRGDVEKVVQVPVGAKGNWDPSINTGTTGSLAPKTAYMLDNGHAYITDDVGRVKAVEGTLSLDKMDRNTYQQLCAGQSGCVGDDGGHLIASSLGGAGDRINIVPQAATLNRQDWKDMENYFRSELQAGKAVNVKIDVGYPASDGVRPDGFVVNAMIDGKPWSKEFKQ